MKKTQKYIIDKQFLINEFNDSIKTYFEDIAWDLRNIICAVRTLIVCSDDLTDKEYNEKQIDLFTEEVKKILYENKAIIQNRINKSFSKLLHNIDK